MDPASLAAICSAALEIGSKIAEVARKIAISRDETELLAAAAAAEGVFNVLSVDQMPGSWIRVGWRSGRRDFCDDKDPAVAATYMDAFQHLCERGYIRHEGGDLFVLSGKGWKVAHSRAKRVER
jgi:hypothetical protein